MSRDWPGRCDTGRIRHLLSGQATDGLAYIRFGSCKRSASIHAGTLGDFEEHIHAFLLTAEGKRLRDYRVERMLFAPEFTPDERSTLEAGGTYRCPDLRGYAALF